MSGRSMRWSGMAALALAGAVLVPAAGALQGPSSLMAGDDVMDMLSAAAPADSPDARLYADANKAIHEGRWADAVKLFDQVASLNEEHAAAALYWKAYAQNKLKDSARAMDTCLSLRMRFAKSGWVEDCGALEIEIRASQGKAVPLEPGQSDELKLLALATQMQANPAAARAQIEQLMQSDSSEHLKEGALFLLGETVPESIYPQIVRISHLEGDVRIARASTNEKSKHEAWEAAEMNLPLAAGDSLVTGADGRVEIEFENASTTYLAPNSVLTFDDLHTTSGVPHSEIELLSGTATIHLDSLKPGEAFLLRTPTNDVLTRYPQRADMRVSSYTDGMALMMLKNGMLKLQGGNEAMTAGRPLFFNKDHAQAAVPEKLENLADFDAWVADRYQARSEAMTAEMKEAGLTTPVPGIADMKGQGRFYPCEPYGTCWEPNSGNGNSLLTGGPPQQPTPKSAKPAAGGVAGASPADFFPCMPGAMINGQYMQTSMVDPWWWSVCHSGWWVYNNQRYVWVAGTKIHHLCPVQWIRFGKTTAFVPLHPRDVKGQPPVNREHGFTATKEKGGGYAVNPIRFEPGRPLELMKTAPKEFRMEPPPPLTRASAPVMEMHPIHLAPAARAGVAPAGAIPLRYDHQTGGFTAPRAGPVGGARSSATFAPVGHTGGFIGRSGGGSFGGQSAMHGGGSGGGGARGGGGSVGGGGGGSHSSGGGTASSGSAASAPAASSNVSGAGGAHK
ncbi:hypothetical protein DYQ86_17115 [Acidobacteria bacterium AB60]|nr:hypothetical protein DYQ86_17115 [Acidobacteria bacterium AB60]